MGLGSAYTSAAAIAARGPVPSPSDLSHPGQLEAAVASRAYRGELILFSFDFCGIGEALSLIMNLRGAGFEHFLPLSDGAETCELLISAAETRHIAPRLPCWYASAIRDHRGWDMWGTAAGCVSGKRATHTCVLEQLWATRYHVAGQILGLGGVNLLHMDTDTVMDTSTDTDMETDMDR